MSFYPNIDLSFYSNIACQNRTSDKGLTLNLDFSAPTFLSHLNDTNAHFSLLFNAPTYLSLSPYHHKPSFNEPVPINLFFFIATKLFQNEMNIKQGLYRDRIKFVVQVLAQVKCSIFSPNSQFQVKYER